MRTRNAIRKTRNIQSMCAVMAAMLWIFGAAQVCGVPTAAGASPPTMSSSQALAQLIAGNQRFQNDTNGHPHLHAQKREELVGGQAPCAAILSCSDSRVPP